jgi:hypothetical protein
MLVPADLDDQQRALYDAIAGGPRAAGPRLFALTDAAGRLNGPFNAMLFAPEVGTALQDLGAAIRYRSSLTARIREMAILAVAAHWDSAFERYAHEAVGRAAGRPGSPRRKCGRCVTATSPGWTTRRSRWPSTWSARCSPTATSPIRPSSALFH